MAIVALACAIGGSVRAQEPPEPTVRPIRFDPDRLTVGRDSFAILLQGSEFGTFTRTRARGGSRFTTTTKFIIAGGAQSATYVLDGTTLAPVSYDQEANQGGQSIELHLMFGDDGHIAGTMAGAFDAVVDTLIESTVYDEDMLPTLVEALEVENGSRYLLDTFIAPRSATMPVSLTVHEGGSITVPAGEYDTWLVALEGGQLPWLYWVTKDGPYRIVKMEITGQLSFELVTAGSR
jgi:hypothetical protein